jgi:phosphoribosylanthranilate isomerase
VRHGGTGRTIDWARAAAVAASRRVMLAGGLTPGNVAEAIRQVRPFGVDVASGIEDQPGIKDAQAMTDFVAAVRGAHA